MLWEVETGRALHTLEGHTDAVVACAFSPDAARIVSAGRDGALKLWDADTGGELRTLRGHGRWVVACAYSPDGAWVVSASQDKTLKLWETETGRAVHTLEAHDGWVNSCVFSPDGTQVASASDDQTVKLWDVRNGRESLTLVGHTSSIRACAFSPDGTRVASVSSDRTLRVWDAESGRCIASLPLVGGGVSVAFHPFRTCVACGDGGGSLHLVDLVGIAVRPPVVTAVDLGRGPEVRCPVCLELHPLHEDCLGQELECPGKACTAQLRINPFVVQRTPPG
jgi:WD40 repeat protein